MLSLAGTWSFRVGDDQQWAQPEHDDSSWSEIEIPAGSARRDAKGEIAWYRVAVDLGPVATEDLRLGVLLGAVDSAYELYAGGIPLGGVGRLPPAPSIDYDRHRVLAVPSSAIGPDGRLTLAMRVWKSPATLGTVGGPIEGPFFLGRIEELTRHELRSQVPPIVLVAIYLLTGLFHLELFRRRPEQRSYLWFAALAIGCACYAFLRSQWKYDVSDDFLLLKRSEHILLYLLLPAFVELLWPLLGLKIHRGLRLLQASSLAGGVAIAASPGLALALNLLAFWQASAAALVVFGLWATLREAWNRNPEARVIAVGAGIAAAGFFHDVGVDRGVVIDSRLASYGFFMLVLSLAVSIANRFQRTYVERDQLRLDLEERIAEREKLIAELETKNAELERYAYTVSHDLKTPVVTIKGFLGSLERDLEKGNDMRVEEDLRRIGRAADHIGLLLDDLLELSRVGHLTNPPEEVPLTRLASDALQTLDGAVTARGVRVEVQPDMPAVWGDRTRLQEMLQNVVENAIKFAYEQRAPRIEIRAATHGSEVACSVRDNGCGIDPAYHDWIFGLFNQLDPRIQGTGIGLAIAQRIVEFHGGRIWVESAGLGEGSTFYFTLPSRSGAVQNESSGLARDDP